MDDRIVVVPHDESWPELFAEIGARLRRELGDTERTKRYFREQPGTRRTHLHVRRAGSFSEQFALLFRDYLRSHPDHAQQYADLKRQLATQFPTQRTMYVNAKTPFIWHTIQLADTWAQSTGWEPPPADR